MQSLSVQIEEDIPTLDSPADGLSPRISIHELSFRDSELSEIKPHAYSYPDHCICVVFLLQLAAHEWKRTGGRKLASVFEKSDHSRISSTPLQ